MDTKFFARELNHWYLGRSGSSLRQLETEFLKEVLPGLFGYYLLQIGGAINVEYILRSPASTNIYLDEDEDFLSQLKRAKNTPKELNFVCGSYEAIPFLYNVIDIVLLSHVLEYVNNPRLVLEEIFNVLVPEGKLIIFGFNPASYLGLRKLIGCNVNGDFLKRGRFISVWRMRSWLNEVGFAIIEQKTLHFNSSVLLNKIGNFLLPHFGSAYVFLAEKKVVTLTPERSKLPKKRLSVSWYPKPTATTNMRVESKFR